MTTSWETAVIFGWTLVILSIFVVVTTLLAANGKIAPNGLLGIRTSATQADEPAWRRAHQAAARLLVPGCTAGVAAGLLLVVGTIGDSSDTAGEIALLGFLALVGTSAFVADRAARAARSA